MVIRLLNFLFEPDGIECLKLDLSRRFSKPSWKAKGFLTKLHFLWSEVQYRTLIYYRLSESCKFPILKPILQHLYHKASLRSGVEFKVKDLGGGVILPHWGRIILNAQKIGRNLYVFHNVTVGNDYMSGKPTIGNNVFIGVNAVILGNITIGDNSIIGACSFVNTDIPSNSMVVGNPAKIIKTINDNFISEMIGY